MNVRGAHTFAAPREVVFAAIRDPRVLMAVIPGCDGVERVAPDEYVGRIHLRLPGAVGTYRTHVRLVDVVEPDRAGLEGTVEGSMGSVTGRADFELAPTGTTGPAGPTDAGPTGAGATATAGTSGTTMAYHGSARIQGPLARLDSRFAQRLAESLIDQGLRALDARLATEGPE